MTKSQIIRELTIELAAKCKRVRELDSGWNAALQKITELETEIERMKAETMALHESWFSKSHDSRDQFQTALGIIK